MLWKDLETVWSAFFLKPFDPYIQFYACTLIFQVILRNTEELKLVLQYFKASRDIVPLKNWTYNANFCDPVILAT